MALKNYRNYAHNSNTQLVTRLFEDDDITYYIQTVKLPGVKNGGITLTTQYGQLQVLGDTNEYETLTLSLILDEDLDVYKTLLKYCQNIQVPGTIQNNDPLNKEMVLIMYNNNNKELLKIRFKNCYLDSIGDLDYTFVSGENEELVIQCVIRYNYMEIVD